MAGSGAGRGEGGLKSGGSGSGGVGLKSDGGLEGGNVDDDGGGDDDHEEHGISTRTKKSDFYIPYGVDI